MRTKQIALQGIIAAVYIVVCLALSPLSYGAIQFRFAEALKVLPYYNRRFTVGLALGCFIVNMFSPMGIVDVLCGTSATIITCLLSSYVKSIWLVAPITAVITGVIVGVELHVLLSLPLIASIIGVVFGELTVLLLGCVGIKALSKDKWIRSILSGEI
jgi:uncharacterized membrane protein